MPARLDFTTPLMRIPGPKLLKSDLGLALEGDKLIVRVKIERGAPAPDAAPKPYSWVLAQELPLPVQILSNLEWRISEYRVVDAVNGMPPPAPIRGRPKTKVLLPVVGASPLVKRPRGRPRKNPLPAAPVPAPAPVPHTGRKRSRADAAEEEKIESSESASHSSGGSDSENGAESSSSSPSASHSDSEAPPAKRRRAEDAAPPKSEEAEVEKDSD